MAKESNLRYCPGCKKFVSSSDFFKYHYGKCFSVPEWEREAHRRSPVPHRVDHVAEHSKRNKQHRLDRNRIYRKRSKLPLGRAMATAPVRYIRGFLREPFLYLGATLMWLFFVGALITAAVILPLQHCAVELTVDEEQIEIDLFDAVNEYREAEGLSPLARVDFLNEVAREHSQYMIEHGLSHSGFSSRAASIKANMSVTLVSENCIYNPRGSYNAHGMAKSWYESAGHRANMLNPTFQRTGVGVAAGNGHVYATQIFTD